MKLSSILENFRNSKYMDIVSSPNFKKWFNGSKVTDKQDMPLIVYHGTTAKFDTFTKGDFGFHFGTKTSATDRVITKSLKTGEPNVVELGQLPYKNLDSELAITEYAREVGLESKSKPPHYREELQRFFNDAHAHMPHNIENQNELVKFWKTMVNNYATYETLHYFKMKKPIPDKQIIPFFLSIKNPIVLPDIGMWTEGKLNYEIKKALKIPDDSPEEKELHSTHSSYFLMDRGIDGVTYVNRYEAPGSQSWIVFEPNQIKSFYNNGEFNRENPNFNR